MTPSSVSIPYLVDFLSEVEQEAPPKWLVEPFLVAGGLHIISGQRKLARKTLFSETLALALARGKPTGPFDVREKHRVLYVQQEGTRRGAADLANALLRTNGVEHEEIKDTFLYLHRHSHFKLDSEDDFSLRLVVSACSDLGIEIVFLDCATFMMTGDENSPEAVGLVTDSLAEIRRRGITPVILVHTGKASSTITDFDLHLRGHSKWADAYDQHLALRRYGPQQAHVALYIRGREVEETTEPYRLFWKLASDEHGRLREAGLAIVSPREADDHG